MQKRNRKLKPLNQDDFAMRIIEDLGMMYATEKSSQKSRFAIFECPYCHKEFKSHIGSVRISTLKIKSCGCYNKKRLSKEKTTHGLRNTQIYSVWNGMKDRCFNGNSKQFKHYGGRGIKVCDEWKNDFKSFYDWAIANGYEKGLTIDRINNNGSYEPKNCRWTTRTIQSRNTRKIWKHNQSGYRGVSFYSSRNKWQARITVNNKGKNLGYFETNIEAAKAYDKYVTENNLEHTKNF